MRFPRAAGVLVHPTSFPGRYGIGDLGEHAYHFVDFLVNSKQSMWQVLPLGPTGYADSPYQCFSAFAGNPLLISPDRLVVDGFLPPTAVQNVPYFPSHAVDYGEVIQYKNALFQQAFSHFQQHGAPEQAAAFETFCAENSFWLDDFALFMAVKNFHKDQSGGVWNTWPAEIAYREPAAMATWSAQLADEIALHKFLQFLFFTQWLALKQYANDRGIKIIGDIPIFVAFDSADVWANRDLFYLKEDGSPEFIAGVPPDYFSVTGQRWGNPLYRWEQMKTNDYAWWVKRLQMTFLQADIVRIDHFRGFEAYWEIPAEEPTAVVGQWVKGPAADFFRAMKEQLGVLPIIAEDLGLITPEVIALRDEFDFPGMKILQFGFGGERNSGFLPHSETPATKSLVMHSEHYLRLLRERPAPHTASIHITEIDKARLRSLIELEQGADIFELEHEIERAIVVDPRQVAEDVVTMNSKALLQVDDPCALPPAIPLATAGAGMGGTVMRRFGR